MGRRYACQTNTEAALAIRGSFSKAISVGTSDAACDSIHSNSCPSPTEILPMKPFHCDACGGLVFFENNTCGKCGHPLGFLPALLDLSALEPAEGDAFRALAPAARDQTYRRCANGLQHDICNWLVPAEDAEPFCVACRLNEMVPDLSVGGNRERWYLLECAKRRLIYTLLKLRLPLDAVATEGRPALRFLFLGDNGNAAPILTGHHSGVITLNIAEADDAVREARRVSLHEPLRTLLGHFRHEIAHYYWDRLIAGSGWLERFRTLFGDERDDYAVALKRHYENGPSPDWLERGVSAYASAHPWEDWAETWAHYLHIIDTIETAAGFGLTLRPRHPSAESMTADPKKAAKEEAGFDLILATWFPLTYALNSLNRGMGLSDLYPFVLSAAAIEKLRFIHEVVEGSRLPAD